MHQRETFAELVRLRQLAVRFAHGDDSVRYEEIEEGFLKLLSGLPHHLRFIRIQLTDLSAGMALNRPESIVEAFYPILAPLLARGERGPLPELEWINYEPAEERRRMFQITT